MHLLHNHYVVMRHGHSIANAERRIVSHPEHGLDGYGLSALGCEQVERCLAQWSRPRPQRVVCSDFRRTHETAERLARHFAIPLMTEPGLRERYFGDFDMGPDRHYREVWRDDQEDAHHTCRGVESVAAVAARIMAVVRALEASYRGERIILIGHGDPLQILLTALADRPLREHRQQPALEPAGVRDIAAAVGR